MIKFLAVVFIVNILRVWFSVSVWRDNVTAKYYIYCIYNNSTKIEKICLTDT